MGSERIRIMTLAEHAPHILVVDDDEAVRTLLRDCFELEGFRVSEARDGQELVARLAASAPDLITLDLKLGGENGLELARKIRETRNVPIVMITGKSDMIDRVVGLELGADDYIGKPFHVREVLARVRAVLRRYQSVPAPADAVTSAAAAGECYVFGDWVLDLPRRELKSAAGSVQDLTTAEFNMLEMFVKRPARVLSRDNIMDLLKGHEWSPFDRSIDALIVRVRRKVEVEPDAPRMIKTVRGVGYVFAAEVKKI
jgi:two-component system, OmpR family, response regulator